MKVLNIKDMVGGWFIGNFEPSAYKNEMFEVCLKKHPKGDVWDMHYHKVATEINLLVEGSMRFQDRILSAGDIFIVYPWEVSNPEFLADCTVVIVKVPSILNDKYSLLEKEKML